MFYHLEGTVSEIEKNMIVIDCNGVGYAVSASMNTISYVEIGKRTKLYISESVREDAFDLFGFSTKAEKRLYDMLTSVSGIGPKAAISILSVNTPEQLILAIASSDEKALTVAQGVGKKTAQRVILELKDKIAGEDVSFAGPKPTSTAAVNILRNDAMNEAMTALNVLGYSNADLAPILKTLDPTGMSVEQIIKAVLKHMV